MISDRAIESSLAHKLNSAFTSQNTVLIQHPRFVHHVDVVDAVPLQATAQIPIPIDAEAAEFYHSPDELLPTNIYVHSDSWSKKIRKQLGDDMKPNVTTLVEKMYNFKTSQALASLSYNTRRAQELLRQMNFVFPVRLRP